MKSRKNYNNACICVEKFDHDEKLCIHNNYYYDIFNSFILFYLNHLTIISGPRACPGESLAKTEMFLVFSNLIQKFRFSKVSVDDVLDFSGITGITTCAPPYRLKVESRHE